MVVENKRSDLCGMFSPNSLVRNGLQRPIQQHRPFTRARYHPQLIISAQAERSAPLSPRLPSLTYLPCTCTHMHAHSCTVHPISLKHTFELWFSSVWLFPCFLLHIFFFWQTGLMPQMSFHWGWRFTVLRVYEQSSYDFICWRDGGFFSTHYLGCCL